MLMILLLVILAAIFFGEVPALWRQKKTRDLVAFCVLFAISAYLGISQLQGWKIPNLLGMVLKLFGQNMPD